MNIVISAHKPFNKIIFDLDGPILDGKLRHYQCYADILIEQGFQPLNIDDYWAMKRDRVKRTVLLHRSHAESIYDVFLEKWLDRIEDKKYLAFDSLQPRVSQILSDLSRQGYQLILATLRQSAANLSWQLEQLGIISYFKHIVSVHDAKLKSTAVKVLLEKDDSKCLWIGDTEVDIESARKLGLPIAVLGCGLRTLEYLQSFNPDYSNTTLEALLHASVLNSRADITTL